MRHTTSLNRQRRGTVTVIVVAFLALFAVIGLTFLIASQRFATTTRLAREAMTRERDTPPQPDVLMQRVMSDLVYGSADDATGVYKATRGWDFARLMYGQNPATPNTLPYSGIGRNLSNPIPAGPPTTVLGGGNDFNLLNYTYFPQDGFVRDPEFTGPTGGFRNVADPTKPIDFVNAPRNPSDFYWPINANYTSADSNNPYLAVIDSTTGKVIMPSFYRPSFGPLDKTNPNWTNSVGKYMIFRPRPAEHSASFPYPKQNLDGTFGDVENLEGKQGGQVQYDSLWMDMDLPVSYWRGKRYKPLVAMLITDLDSRINLNTAGNMRNAGGTHGSNQNWGPWEVNLDNILAASGDTNRLLRGFLNATSATAGRYGGLTATSTPGAYPQVGPFVKPFTTYANDVKNNNPVGGYLPHFYAPVDMDGGVAINTPGRWRFPNPGTALTAPTPNGYEAFPVYGPQTSPSASAPFTQPTPYDGANRYWNGMSDNEPTTVYSERLNHPMMFNPYLNPFRALSGPAIPVSTESKTFTASEMIALNGKYIPTNNTVHPVTGGSTLNTYTGLIRSDAARLTSLGIGANAANRFRVTTISNDIDLPGGTPWMGASATPFVPPTYTQNYPYVVGTQPHNFDATLGGGDFDPIRKQSLAGVLGSVDINRPLTDYRANTNIPYAENNLAPPAQLAQALADRQLLAADIFVRLRAATGTPEPDASLTLAANPQGFRAAQALAQLAVNIVDYIDHDDYVTPFNWNPNIVPGPIADNNGNLQSTNAQPGFVFGHELPRLVVNEVMARLENDPSEPDILTPPAMNGDRKAQKPYKMRLWAELHNPLTPRDATEIGQLADQGQARLVSTGASGPQYAVYRMRIVKSSPTAITSLTDPSNVGGEPPASEVRGLPAVINTTVGSPIQMVYPNLIPSLPSQVVGYNNTNLAQPSFYLVGPKGDSSGGLPVLPDSTAAPNNTAAAQFDNMEYDVNSPGGSPGLEPAGVIADTTWSPIVVLQRLANEHLPPSQTNPYITVDTFMPANYNPQAPTALNTGAGTINPVSIVQDRLQITPTVDRIKGMMIPNWNSISSFGKRQPYLSYMHIPTPSTDTNYKQQPSEATMSSQMQHTFKRHNGKQVDGAPSGGNDTLDRPFSTLLHLDRNVTSAAELLNVSQFGSHMVTLLNYIPPPANYTTPPVMMQPLYRAGWFEPGTMLYRAFDLLTTKKRFYGQGVHGRVPGLVNINTVTDPEVFNSIMDRQHVTDLVGGIPGTSGKHYTQSDVDNLWTTLISIRQNPSKGPFLGTMSPSVQPGAGDPQYPNGMDMSRTLVGLVAATPLPTPHPSGLPADQIRQELLATLLPNVTTRSNTFAVYATFGFFEVLNPGTGTDGLTYDDTNRPKLGAEVIGVDGKPVRYKFFSIIDRTQLSVDNSTNTLQGLGNVHFSYEPVAYNTPPTLPSLGANPVLVGSPDPQPNGSAINVMVAIPRTSFTAGVASGYYDGVAWKMKAGDQLLLEGFPDVGPGPGVVPAGMMLPNTPVGSSRNKVEFVNIAQILDDPPNGRVLVSFSISKPHYRGANMRLMAPDLVNFPFQSRPGNPRTQSNSFNLGASTYKSVIPVFERIDGY